MNLSDKIFKRDALRKMNLNALEKQYNVNIEEYNSVKNTYALDKEFNSHFQSRVNIIQTDLQDLVGMRDRYVEQLNMEIETESAQRIVDENIKYADATIRLKTAEYSRQYRQLKVSSETEAIVTARIGRGTAWHCPGLEIGPRDGEWTPKLVACDPLYLIDYDDECLDNTLSQFPAQYQARLRVYTNMGTNLHMLPHHQFGFIFSWNRFNYCSLIQIERHLKEIKLLLRPGGSCMFSYNNGERPHCAEISDNQYMTLIPKGYLVKALQDEGFVNIRTCDKDSTVSWVEFNMPGKLESIRIGQTLGKIFKQRA